MFPTAFLDLPALGHAHGTVRLPGSKSISNRVLLLAALCTGTTTVHDLLDSDDTQVMLDALRTLGCGIRPDGPDTVHIDGMGANPPVRQAELFLGNAGTAMRPLTAALAVLGGQFDLRGVARMHERPIGDLVDALRLLGCQIEYLGQDGYPPLRIGTPTLRLDAPIRVRGDVSSQFLTALLMALPLAATRAIIIEVDGLLISRPYIDITLKLLARFGVTISHQNWQRFTIPAGAQLRSPGILHIEADASSASYFVALGAIATRAEDRFGIKVEGVGADSIQGDIRFVDAARSMGAHIDSGPNWLQIRRGAWPLRAIDLDCNHIPDAAMTLAVMALYARGTTTLRNIASWRVKETDRLAAMATELRKLGATVTEGADSLHITPPGADTQTAGDSGWRAASIHTYDDHRMAMCFSLAAFNAAGASVRIQDPKCVAKTFPDYFEALFSLCQTPYAHIPVLCVDGPTASGKGTLAATLAQRLGYHFLDSGALYRITALCAERAGIGCDPDHAEAIAALPDQHQIAFEGTRILLDGEDISAQVRSEHVGMLASRVAALEPVRKALLQRQRAFRCLPGLVADGRDMGTVVFPDARLKVYLTASVEQRANRRWRQLLERGIDATLDSLCEDLKIRDARDSSRASAPLKPAQDALALDNSELSIDASIARVLDWWQDKQPFKNA